MRKPPKINMPPQSAERLARTNVKTGVEQRSIETVVPTKRGERTLSLAPIVITEKIMVRSRPEKIYYALLNQTTRPSWDKNVVRVRFMKPSRNEVAPTKPAQDVVTEFVFPLGLGGVFHMRYALLQQPHGFALEAVRGAFGVLAGMAESWAFVPFKGGTEVTLQRTIVPRFKMLRNYVERNHSKAIKQTLEGMRKFVEANQS